MQENISKILKISDEFVELRRDIHHHPELSFEEHRTSKLVADKLRAWGYEVATGLGGTGVVGSLTKGNGSKKLGIRADMDALPIMETNEFPWASKNANVMHACGHDGHTAMLMCAAKHLAQEGEFDGTLNLIFQPAEEGDGGANKMIDDGLFERFPCDAVFGMHNMPGVEQGHFAFRSGPMMASADDVTVKILGVGGHGAMPHTTVDPVVTAASIVMALQTVVARNVGPLDTAVITVGALLAGKANNVIPETATIELSVRALKPETRVLLKKRIHEVIMNQAASYGARAEIFWHPPGCAVLVNGEAETDFARAVAIELVGAEKVTLQCEQITGSEDFAAMLEKVPGSYLLIGNGAGSGAGSCTVHNSGYDFNDGNIVQGSAYWVSLVEKF